MKTSSLIVCSSPSFCDRGAIPWSVPRRDVFRIWLPSLTRVGVPAATPPFIFLVACLACILATSRILAILMRHGTSQRYWRWAVTQFVTRPSLVVPRIDFRLVARRLTCRIIFVLFETLVTIRGATLPCGAISPVRGYTFLLTFIVLITSASGNLLDGILSATCLP